MHKNIGRLIAATLVLALCRAGTDPGQATVIRDRQGSPAVESGGHRLSNHKPPAIPYSLIGAIQTAGLFYGPYPLWPYPLWQWHMLGSFSRHQPSSFHRIHAMPNALPAGFPLLP